MPAERVDHREPDAPAPRRRRSRPGASSCAASPTSSPGGGASPALDLEIEDHGENVYAIARDDPLSAEVRCVRSAALFRPGFDVRIEADARMRCTADEFIVETDLRAYDAGVEIASRLFETRVRRADA